jgi:glycosyltransferase involved in cell wall biosynthesis
MPSSKPKVVTISTHDMEGGAARAAFRLHQGLLGAGADARMLVQRKLSDDLRVYARGAHSKWARGFDLIKPWMDMGPLVFYPNRGAVPWSCNWLPGFGSIRELAGFCPDIVHLHWVGGGFVPLGQIPKFQSPVVWTLHDMWAFTGGCHYDDACGRYREGCGACPQLNSRASFDLSRWTWRRKSGLWAGLNLTLVCPSRWMADCAGRSALFRGRRIEVIPNGLDLAGFKPMDKAFCKRLLGFPENKRMILFGAMAATRDKKKGFAHLAPALRKFAQTEASRGCELVIFGASRPEDPPDFGLPGRYMGRLRDEISLAALYSAADVMVAPSLQDNLPNTVMESLACGTPVAAFEVGGMPDLIEHGQNGFLARPLDAEHLAAGIRWILEDGNRWNTLSANARSKAEASHALSKVAERHLNLYAELLAE